MASNSLETVLERLNAVKDTMTVKPGLRRRVRARWRDRDPGCERPRRWGRRRR